MQNKTNRYFLEIAYKGTAYHGWQIQDNAVSVQEKLNTALQTILRQDIETVGAGRTDTGVHAKQLFAHIDIVNHSQLKETARFLHAVNALLPHDIAAKRIIPVKDDAHARFDATERSYEYRIHFEKDPFLHQYSWQLRDRPDVGKMNKAASFLLGTQDFGCFSKSNTQVFTNICTIKEARWVYENDKLVFHITADRFLRNMVRAIVGTLIEIGTKNRPIEHLKEVIASQDRGKAGTSVPACGLYLTRIRYPYID